MPVRPYPSWQRRHEAILLWVIENPSKTLKHCAQETGYSRSHISRIMQSPEFKERYRAARNRIEKEISRKYVERIASM